MSTMSTGMSMGLPGRLAALREELIEQAFELEQRGAVEAADLAMIVSARLGELCAEAGNEGRRGDVRVAAVGSSAC